MTIDPTPRFGMELDTDGSTNWSRARIMAALQSVETSGARLLAGAMSTRPAATAAMKGTFWWTGQRLSFADPDHLDAAGLADPRWIDLDPSMYVNVADYGAEPLDDPAYVPRAFVGTPPNPYDPYAHWRSRDCTAKITEAANDAITSGRILFFPPGVYPVFGPIVLSGAPSPVPFGPTSGRAPAAASTSANRWVHVLGSFPNTILWCFGETTGTDEAGGVFVYPGFNSSKTVIAINDVTLPITGAIVDGFRFVGGAWNGSGSTSVQSCVGYESNAQTITRQIVVEPTVITHGSAIDLSAGSMSITSVRPHLVEHTFIYGTPVPFDSRTGVLDPAIGNSVGLNLSFPFIRARNIHVEHYGCAVMCAAGNGVDAVVVEGLSVRGSAFADFVLLGHEGGASGGNLTVRGYSSWASARMLHGEVANADISGVFRAEVMGYPAETTGERADLIRFLGYGLVKLNDVQVTNTGGMTRTIGVMTNTGPIEVCLVSTVMPANVANIIRPIAGSTGLHRITAWDHKALDPVTGAVAARQTWMPAASTATFGTPTASAPTAALTDASAAAEISKHVAELERVLKAVGLIA